MVAMVVIAAAVAATTFVDYSTADVLAVSAAVFAVYSATSAIVMGTKAKHKYYHK